MTVPESQEREKDMPDEERTAFGLGWEYKRRGRPITDNPFPSDHWRFQFFRDGWFAFTDHELKQKDRKL